MMDNTENKEIIDFVKLSETETAVLFYFSHENCNVCKVLRPKVFDLIQTDFPKIKVYYIDVKKFPDTAAFFSVFVSPTILVFFEGKEYIRKSRNFGVEELGSAMDRIYKIIFG